MERQQPQFREVRDPQTGKLLFRYDPVADVVEVKPKGAEAVQVALTPYRLHAEVQQ
jgi:hypothetical protein